MAAAKHLRQIRDREYDGFIVGSGVGFRLILSRSFFATESYFIPIAYPYLKQMNC